MSKRQVRKMLRRMASGEPVQVSGAVMTMKRLARLAFIAEQFGYAYADVRQGGGPDGKQYMLMIVPDPSPQARERAARNRARYPDAGDGGALPPFEPDAVALLRTRISFDLVTRYTEKQQVVLMSVGFTGLSAVLGAMLHTMLGSDTKAVAIASVVWVVLLALMPVLLAANRRYRARYADRLRDAGFTPVTDPSGRLRYVPPGGQLPGHGNPFAPGAVPPNRA